MSQVVETLVLEIQATNAEQPLQRVQIQLVSTGTAAKDLENRTKSLSDAHGGLAGSLETIEDKLKEQVFTIGAVVAGYVSMEAVIGNLRESIGLFAEFDETMQRLRATTGVTAGDFDTLAASAEHMGATSIFSATQSAQGMQVLAKAGFDTKDIIAQLPAVYDLAVVGQMDMAAAGDVVGLSLHRFGMEASSTEHVVDVLATTTTKSRATVQDIADTMRAAGPAAANLGLTFDMVAATLAVMAQNGGNARQMGGALMQALNILANPTKATELALRSLGLTMSDINPRTHSLVDILTTFQKVTLDSGTAAAMFGAQGGAAILSLVHHLPELVAMNQTMASSAGNGKALADTMEDNLQTAGVKLAGTMEAVKLQVGAAMGPALSAAAKQLQDYFTGGTSSAAAFGKAMGSALSGVVSVFLAVVQHGREVEAIIIALAVAFAVMKIGPLIVSLWELVAAETALGVAENLLIAVTLGLEAAWDALLAAMAANPITTVAVALGALAAILYEVWSRTSDASAAERKYRDDILAGSSAVDGETNAHDKLVQKLKEEIAARQELSGKLHDNQALLAQLQPILDRMGKALAAGDTAGYLAAVDAVQKLGLSMHDLGNNLSVYDQLKAEVHALQLEHDATTKKVTDNNSRMKSSQEELRSTIASSVADEIARKTTWIAKIAEEDAAVARARLHLAQLQAVSFDPAMAQSIDQASAALEKLAGNAELARKGLANSQAALAAMANTAREQAKTLFSQGQYQQGSQLAASVGASPAEIAAAVAQWKAYNTELAANKKAHDDAAAALEKRLAAEREFARLNAAEILVMQQMRQSIKDYNDIATAYGGQVGAAKAVVLAKQDDIVATQKSAKVVGELKQVVHDLSLEESAAARNAKLADAEYAARFALQQQVESGYAAIKDAQDNTTLGSKLMAEQLKAEALADQYGVSVMDSRIQKTLQSNVARVLNAELVANSVKVSHDEQAQMVAVRDAQAALTDEITRGTNASRQAAIDKQVEANQLALNAKAGTAWGDVVRLDTVLMGAETQTVKDRTAAQQQLNSFIDAYNHAAATTADAQTKIALERQYGDTVANLAVSLGAASSAERQLAIDEAVRTEAAKEGKSADLDAIATIRLKITAQQQSLNGMKDELALAQASANVWKPMQDGFTSAIQVGQNALNTFVETGKVDVATIGKDLLDIFLKAFEQILANWIQLQAAMAAAQASGGLAGTAAAAGGVGGAVGAGAGTAALSSAASALGASAGALQAAAAALLNAAGVHVVASTAGGQALVVASGVQMATTASTSVVFVAAATSSAAATTGAATLQTSSMSYVSSLLSSSAFALDGSAAALDGAAAAQDASAATGAAGNGAGAGGLGSMFSGIGNLFGGSAFGGGAGGAAAAAGAWAAVYVAVTLFVINMLRVHENTKAALTLLTENGQFMLNGATNWNQQSALLAQTVGQVVDRLNQFLHSIAATVTNVGTSMLAITREGRNDNVKFNVDYVNQYGETIVRSFGNDAIAAMDYAFYTALSLATLGPGSIALDPLVQAAVTAAAKRAADAMQAGLSQAEKDAINAQFNSSVAAAQEVSTLGQPQFVATERTAIIHFDDLRQAMEALNLPTAQLVTALGNINAAEVQMWQAERDTLTGHQQTRAEQLATAKQNAEIFNAELAMRILNLKQSVLDLQVQKNKIDGLIAADKAEIASTGIHLGGIRAILDGTAAWADFVDATTGQTVAQMQQASDLIGQEIDATNKLIDDLNKIKPIDPSTVKLPATGGSSSGSSAASTLASALSTLQTAMRNLAEFALSPYRAALAQINDKYDDAIKAAGKNKKAVEDLIAARQAEIDLLNLQTRASIWTNITPYVQEAHGLSPFEQQLKDLATKFAGYTQAAKDAGGSAQLLNAILTAQHQALLDLGKQLIQSLNLPLEQTRQTAEAYLTSLTDLNAALQAGAIDQATYNRVIGELADQMTGQLMGMLQGLINSTGNAAEMAKAKAQIDQANFALQLAQANLLYNTLLAAGAITPAIQAAVLPFLTWLNDPSHWPDFTKLDAPPPPTSSTGAGSTPSTDIATLTANVQAQIAAWNAGVLGQAAKQAQTLKDQYTALVTAAGNYSWVLNGLDAAYANAKENLVGTILTPFENLDESALNKQLDTLQSQLADAAQALTILGASSADFARLAKDSQAALSNFWKTATQPTVDEIAKLKGLNPAVTSGARIQDLEAKFAAAIGQVQHGDLGGIATANTLADQLQQLGATWFGTNTGAYNALLTQIETGLQGIVNLGTPPAETAASQLSATKTSNDFLSKILAQLQGPGGAAAATSPPINPETVAQLQQAIFQSAQVVPTLTTALGNLQTLPQQLTSSLSAIPQGLTTALNVTVVPPLTQLVSKMDLLLIAVQGGGSTPRLLPGQKVGTGAILATTANTPQGSSAGGTLSSSDKAAWERRMQLMEDRIKQQHEDNVALREAVEDLTSQLTTMTAAVVSAVKVVAPLAGQRQNTN